MIARLGLFVLLFIGVGSVPRPAHAEIGCTPARAQTATIEAVQADFKSFAGRCVRFRGLAVRGRLYRDRQALLDPPSPLDEAHSPSIAIYPENVEDLPAKAAIVEIVGRIGSCATANAAAMQWMNEHPGGIAMVSGYCHTSNENYIRPESVRIVGWSPILRLTEAEVPPERRPLVEASARALHRTEHEAIARALAEAIARGDEAAFIKAAHPELQRELESLGGAEAEPWVPKQLAGARKAFRTALRRSPFRTLGTLDMRQKRVFIRREELAEDEPQGRFITCWCRERDCTGRWPVTVLDADNDPRRPYACVDTYQWVRGPDDGTAIAADATSRSGFFAEPDWSRSAR